MQSVFQDIGVNKLTYFSLGILMWFSGRHGHRRREQTVPNARMNTVLILHLTSFHASCLIDHLVGPHKRNLFSPILPTMHLCLEAPRMHILHEIQVHHRVYLLILAFKLVEAPWHRELQPGLLDGDMAHTL